MRESGYYWTQAQWGKWFITFWESKAGVWVWPPNDVEDNYWKKIDEVKLERLPQCPLKP